MGRYMIVPMAQGLKLLLLSGSSGLGTFVFYELYTFFFFNVWSFIQKVININL